MKASDFNALGAPKEDKANYTMSVIGGILQDDRMCQTDINTVHTLLRILSTYDVPLSSSLTQYQLTPSAVVDQSVIDMVNYEGLGHPDKSGERKRDFLTETTDTNILVLANVAYQQSRDGNYLEGMDKASLSIREIFQLQDSMSVSPHNQNVELWEQKIKGANARIIIMVGKDDFPPEGIAGDQYVMLSGVNAAFNGVLMSRAYLKEIAADLKTAKSPLHHVAVLANSNLDIVEFKLHPRDLKFTHVDPYGFDAPPGKGGISGPSRR